MNRSGNAVWHGTGKEGNGTLTTMSGAIKNLPYSWMARFGDQSGMTGTNPEEMIAAAHAGCFTMAAAFQFGGAGFPPEELKTDALMTVEQSGTAWSMTKIVLKLNAKIPNITEEKFQELANNAKEGCPVSRALKGSIDISLEATLAK